MKKIVALVLCLALALSLATVAMAAKAGYDAYVKGSEVLWTEGEEVITFVAGSTKNKTVDHYTITTDRTYTFVKCADDDAGFYLVPAGTNEDDLAYVKKIPVKNVDSAKYAYVGKAFTATNKCGTPDAEDVFTEDIKFYSVYDAKEKKTTYYYGVDVDGIMLNVNGELVMVGGISEDAMVDHEWKIATQDKEENILTVKCSKCNTVGTVYSFGDTVPAGAETANVFVEGVNVDIYYKAGSTAGGDGVESAETFDAGIAVYAGMALASVAGSAVVIGKKKEF